MSGLSGTLPLGAFTYITPSVTPEVTTFRNGFQYTLLVRGQDIRRMPAVQIGDFLNNTPNTCNFTIDGASNAPVNGEKIEIIDTFDSDRLMFRGIILKNTLIYEGQTNQLAWQVECVDFTWLLNKKRPFGNYNFTSASDIVKDLVVRYAPEFTSFHVQTNLAPVTISFNGQDDFGTCLSKIAELIGGGHWDVDYDQDIHFFHVVPEGLAPPVAIQANLGDHMSIAEGALLSLVGFQFGYYFLRYTFVYSDGSESSFGAISNMLLVSGGRQLDVTNVPIGIPLGTLTVVSRRVYFNVLVPSDVAESPLSNIQKLCEIPDNVTDHFSWFTGTSFSSGVNTMAADVVVPPESATGHPAAPSSAPQLTMDIMGPDSLLWSGISVAFRVAFLYRDGSLSFPSDASNIQSQALINGYGVRGFSLTNVVTGAPLGTNDVVARVIYYASAPWNAPNQNTTGPFTIGYRQPGDWGSIDWGNSSTSGIAIIADNATTSLIHFELGGLNYQERIPNYFENVASVPYDGVLVGRGNRPIFDGQAILSTDPIPIWPNPDGPSLELDTPPLVLDDSNPYLLRDGAGQAFTVFTDNSQIRNKVMVIGSGSSLVDTALAGATKLKIADISTMSPNGGTVRCEDPSNGQQVDLKYKGITGVPGAAFIVLDKILATPLYQGTTVNNFFVAEDKNSQQLMARVELDKDGNPTDGIHEYVIIDTTLKATFQLYMRAYAELELFALPIIQISYSTTDPTKSGQTIEVDLTNPPCIGSFLVQEVQIDHVRDEGDAIAPRYTVTASSTRFELNDLLLKILGSQNASASTSGGGGTSAAGVAQVSLLSSSGSLNNIFAQLRGLFFYAAPRTTGGPGPMFSIGSSGMALTALGTSSFLTDVRGVWNRSVANAGFNNPCGFFIVDGTGGVARVEHNPQLNLYIRTGSISAVRLYIGLFAGTNPVNSDSLSVQGVGIRFSSVASDGGFRLCARGTDALQTLGGTFPTLEPNQEYDIQIKLTAVTMDVTINSPSFAVETVSMLLPQGLVGVDLNPFVQEFAVGTVAGQQLDLARIAIQNGYL